LRYHLEPVASADVTLPKLATVPSPNRSSRGGRRPRLVFVHTWGGGTYDGTVTWLCEKGSNTSAHLVYAGEHGPDAGKCAQLVPFGDKAWTECELNAIGISVESADAIWQGRDPHGFERLARIVAGLCHYHLDACRYVTAAGIVAGSHGFTRHADGGALGCGHLACPTTDGELWAQFCERVVLEYRRGGFRPSWGADA
jgi:N-acetyl-anhydromuramyl-L-alanine amidase AmpD